MSPKVSVIVATYRRNEELWNALVSLSNQSYGNYEVVVVDDNGVAEWNEIVQKNISRVKADYPSVQIKYLVNSPNQGSAKTRNIGIAASDGEYVTFLDDDDIYLSQKVEHQAAFMIDNDLDYSITDLELFNERDKMVDIRRRTYIKETSKESLLEYHLKYHITGTDTMMFKKTYIDSIGGFSPIDVGDEFYLMQRAIEGNGRFGYLPVCDVKAYVHTGENGLSSGDSKIKGEKDLFEHKKKYFNILSSKTIKFIKSRHHAVLAYAYLRMRRILPFVKEAMLSFVSSPVSCAKIFFGFEN